MLPFDSPSVRVRRAGSRRLARAPLSWALPLLAGLSSACGQAGLVEAEAPIETAQARQLAPAAPAPVRSEVLRARVEAFGLTVATLESSSCATPEARSIETRVEAAPLVKVIRRTGGEATTWLLDGGNTPRSSDYTFQDGDLIRHYEVDYRAGGYRYVYDNGGVARRVGSEDVPEGAEPHDLHSAVLLLRSWRPRLEERAYFYVVLGRRPWRVDVTSRGPEMITLGEDHRLSYRIDGVATRLWEPEKTTPKRFSFWLSEDSARTPLRMVGDASFGQVTISLTGNTAAAGACTPTPSKRREAAGAALVPRIGTAWTRRSPVLPGAERASAAEP